MTEEKKTQPEKKGIFARIVDMLDKKLEKKAKDASCRGGGGEDKGSCC